MKPFSFKFIMALSVVLQTLACVSALICISCPPGMQSFMLKRQQYRNAERELNALNHYRREAEKGCSHKPADIVFVLDESGSIYPEDFDKQIDFVKDVIALFEISDSAAHIGAMTFASTTKPQFQLNTYNNEGDIVKAFEGIWQEGGGTKTHKALELLRTDFLSPDQIRPNVKHIGIVITDGASEYPEETAAAAKALKDEGITLISIGVGRDINQQELEAIASEPAAEHAFMVDDYDSLQKLKYILAWKACEITTTTPRPTPPQLIEGCSGGQRMDIIFGLPDRSSRVDEQHSISFVESIIDDLKLGPSKVQVGVTPRDCYNSQDAIYLKDHDTISSFTSNLANRYREGSHTQEQLRFLHEEGFTAENGGRENAMPLAVLIIDDKSNYEAVLEEAELCRDRGIHLLVIAVGSGVESEELLAIAGSDDNIMKVASHEDLPSVKKTLLDKLCSV